MKKKSKVFSPGHKWTTQVNSLSIQTIDKWILHLVCTYWCIYIPIEAKGMNSLKSIESKLGFLPSKEETIESLNRLIEKDYIKGISKERQYGALRVNFQVNSFNIQNEFEAQYDISIQNDTTPKNGVVSPF